jgi:hypothetical protein
MKVLIDKSFSKDLRKIDDKKIKNSLADIIESVASAKTISSLKNSMKVSKKKYYAINK